MDLLDKVDNLLKNIRIDELKLEEISTLHDKHNNKWKELFEVYVCNKHDGYRVQLIPRNMPEEMTDYTKNFMEKQSVS